MQLLLSSLSDAKQQMKDLEEEHVLLKDSEAKRSEEAADLKSLVKKVMLDEWRSNKKLERLEKVFNFQKEEISQLKGEIARGRKEMTAPTNKRDMPKKKSTATKEKIRPFRSALDFYDDDRW